MPAETLSLWPDGRAALPGQIVQIALPDALKFPLTDGHRVPAGQVEGLVGGLDLVHVHQKALVAAEEPPVPQLLLHSVQRLIDHVGLAVPAVEHALCVLAFHI